MATVGQQLMSDLKGRCESKVITFLIGPPLLLESIGAETKKDNIKADSTLGCLPLYTTGKKKARGMQRDGKQMRRFRQAAVERQI